MKLYLNEKIEDIVLVPHISRNVQRKHTQLLLERENQINALRKEYKDVIAFLNENGFDEQNYLKAKSKNKEIDLRMMEFKNQLNDIESINEYKNVIIATNRFYLSDKLKPYFIDFDNLSDIPDSPNYSKLSREEILDFWNDQDKIEIEKYLNSFRKFIQ